jgi:glycosyltransferase involved in cell wall biosynthesis
MSLLEIVFWSCGTLLAYIYAGYPLLIGTLARLRRRRVRKGAFTGTISVILVAHNEAARLTAKLSNLLMSTAAPQIIEVLVGSDGSTDATAVIASSYPDLRVHGIAFSERRGKPSVINDLVQRARGEILLFLDARQDLAPDAIARMLANFADGSVGLVSGELVFRRDAESGTAAEGMGFYWKYEKRIRNAEGQFRSIPGATGAI